MSRDLRIAVAGRISIRALADVHRYFMSNGLSARTMSQLAGWSVEHCRDMLVQLGHIEEDDKMDLETAHRYLEAAGLRQVKVRARAARKELLMRGFNELEKEGFDPKQEAPIDYKRLHNQREYEALGDNDLACAGFEASSVARVDSLTSKYYNGRGKLRRDYKELAKRDVERWKNATVSDEVEGEEAKRIAERDRKQQEEFKGMDKLVK
jgi:hypothetical protein